MLQAMLSGRVVPVGECLSLKVAMNESVTTSSIDICVNIHEWIHCAVSNTL